MVSERGEGVIFRDLARTSFMDGPLMKKTP